MKSYVGAPGPDFLKLSYMYVYIYIYLYKFPSMPHLRPLQSLLWRHAAAASTGGDGSVMDNRQVWSRWQGSFQNSYYGSLICPL